MEILKEVPAPVKAFPQPIAEHIWRSKYQYIRAGHVVDHTVEETWLRIANTLSKCEAKEKRARVAAEFYDGLANFELLPGGRILAGCGTKRDVTLANTFVMRTLPDSIEGIMDTAKEAALTMKMGGGLGFDFSTLRPAGTPVQGLDCPAAGPLMAMDIFDSVCKLLVSGTGRGAMMATMRCDHPDIEAFISVKSDPNRLRNFNMSVMVTDEFMQALAMGRDVDLVWEGQVHKTVSARDLWDKIMRQTYIAAEPGVLFIDRINDLNPLGYLETIRATNSCAEQPLPPYGVCPLASINLSRLVRAPFTANASLDGARFRHLAGLAVRLLDNVIDTSRYPLPQQHQQAIAQRRIGVGVTGVANALAMLGVTYGSSRAAYMLSRWMEILQNETYRASALLAQERGVFPSYNPALHQSQNSIRKLSAEVRALVSTHGLRNGTLTTIAPTGTISMLAGNVSSGIEPIFSTSFLRSITRPDGSKALERVTDYAALMYRQLFGPEAALPKSFKTASDLCPKDHVKMQAAAQKWVDGGISKTVNCPEDIAFEDFKAMYLLAYREGCKGCTTYRPNAITGSVLSL